MAARLNGSSEVGRRGTRNIGLHELHIDAVDAHRCGAISIGVNDNVFGRVDVDLRPGVGRQGGDGEMIVMDNDANRGAGNTGGRAKGIRPCLGNVGVKGVGMVYVAW